MKRRFLGLGLAIAMLATTVLRAVADESPRDLDLRRAVPADAFMAVYGKHNPERDYQRDYYQQVWQTMQDTQIIERVVKIATKRMSADDLEKARGVMEQLQEAAAPIDLEAIFNCEEAVYGQLFQVPTAQHIAAFRLSGEAAGGLEQGLTNLFRKAEELYPQHVSVETSEQHGSTITSLRLPQEVPFSPTVIRKNDVVLISSSRELAALSLSMLVDGTGPSKFDDPRLRHRAGSTARTRRRGRLL